MTYITTDESKEVREHVDVSNRWNH